MKKIIKNILRLKEDESSSVALIPSENVMSDFAASMYALWGSNRYILKHKYGDISDMPGRENLSRLLTEVDLLLAEAYGTKYAISKGFSGLHNMDIIFSALSGISKIALILKASDGGHSKTKGVAEGHGYTVEEIGIDFTNWDLNYKDIQRNIDIHKSEKVLIYLDHTVCLNPVDMYKLMKIVPKRWFVYYDISHLQLFYFSHIFSFPSNSNLFYGGSTHKTFPGPQKSIVLLNDEYLFNLINNEFDAKTSSIHTGSLLALLVTIIEMNKFGKKYANEILHTTKVFAKILSNDLDLVGPNDVFTNTHQICINVDDAVNVTVNLSKVGIVTTPMRVPSSDTLGLRLGIQELVRRGIREKDLKLIAKVISVTVNSNRPAVEYINDIKKIAHILNKIKFSIDNNKASHTNLFPWMVLLKRKLEVIFTFR